MPAKKIIFLGSKPIGYQCLDFLISRRDELNIEIAGVLTNQRTEFSGANDLNSLARQHSLPVFTTLDDMPECDVIYSVQYHQLLKKPHLDKARQAAVNLHMAPLPEYRGSNQFSFAIIDGKEEFGATIHQIDSRIDHGDILFQKRFPIPPDCWVSDLYRLTFEASVALFKQTIGHVVNGSYTPVPQHLLIPRYGTCLHYRNEVGMIKKIDLAWDKEKIERHIRATSMPGFDPPYCIINGEKILFTR